MNTERENKVPFQRHKEEMASFRRTHARIEEGSAGKLSRKLEGTKPYTVENREQPSHFFTDEYGRIIVVPIWNVSLPRDSQN